MRSVLDTSVVVAPEVSPLPGELAISSATIAAIRVKSSAVWTSRLASSCRSSSRDLAERSAVSSRTVGISCVGVIRHSSFSVSPLVFAVSFLSFPALLRAVLLLRQTLHEFLSAPAFARLWLPAAPRVTAFLLRSAVGGAGDDIRPHAEEVLTAWAKEWAKEEVEIDWQKLLPPRGFRVLPRRWVVERTFSWLMQNRRMSQDYEKLCATGEAFVYASMTRLMARRLARA
jgi:hypothetical protein